MTFDYSNKNYPRIKTSLERAHNPDVCPIRTKMFDAENSFFRKSLVGGKVLVAGSGLGHDSFELAEYNKEVVGVDVISELILDSVKELVRKEYSNIYFRNADFFNLDYKDKTFDAAVLNMGTIGNFENRHDLLKELTRVADKVVFSYYVVGEEKTKKRFQMYVEEGFHGLPKIVGNKIIGGSGFVSEAIEATELYKIADSMRAELKIYPLYDFVNMAELYVR